MADAIELDALSEDLDAAMVAALGRRVTSLNAADYGRAYRKVGRRADRQRQIDLIQHLGHSLDRLTHQRFVATTLAIMRKPAKLAGLGDLHGFLERGFTAFRKMGNADEFLDAARHAGTGPAQAPSSRETTACSANEGVRSGNRSFGHRE